MKQVFTTGQVARLCGVAPRTATQWCDKGMLGSFRIPGSRDRRVPREQLVKFLNEHGMPLGGLEADDRCKVLVLSQESGLASKLAGLLPENAYRCDPAPDGFGAGIKAETTYYEVVVLDLAIGRSEALHIAKRLRQSQRHGGAVLIALAGEDEADMGGLSSCGFGAAFKKPFDVAQLAERIRTPPIEQPKRNRFGPPLPSPGGSS